VNNRELSPTPFFFFASEGSLYLLAARSLVDPSDSGVGAAPFPPADSDFI